MSDRDITVAFADASVEQVVRPFFAVDLDFSSGAVRAWNGSGSITFDGKTFTGVNNLGQIDPVQESVDLRANNVRVGLGGIPSAMIALALADHYQGRPGIIYFGLLNSSGAVIADPDQVFSGRIDTMEINEGPDGATIWISIESLMIDLGRSPERRYTDGDQQAEFPGDKFFEFVTSIQDKEIVWGQPLRTAGGGSTGGVDPNNIHEKLD